MQHKNKRYFRRRPRGMDSLKKGVYILPNFLTSLSLFCGFFAVVSTMQGAFVRAAWAIIIAAVFDGLDGRIARMTHTTTRFGLEYDSLSDLVAFGVAPAVLSYGIVLNQYGRWGWLAAFLYVACGAIRLARFNTLGTGLKTDYFLGLPIPAAAGTVATTILFCRHFSITEGPLLGVFLLLTIYALAFLMVSTIRYRSFKNLHLGSRKPFSSVIVAILIICIVASEPQIMLFIMALVYAASGPAGYAMYLARKKARTQSRSTTVEEKDEHQKIKS